MYLEYSWSLVLYGCNIKEEQIFSKGEIKFHKGVIHYHFLPELLPAKNFSQFKDLFSLMKFKSEAVEKP
jgi:hypothetical protein